MYQDGQSLLGNWKRGLIPRPASVCRAARQRGAKKVGMMADVACFCGCFYSFDGAAGACPQCGEIASVGSVPESIEPGRPEHRVPVANGVRRDGEAPGTFPEWVEAGAVALSGRMVSAGSAR